MEKAYRIRTEIDKDTYIPINLSQDIDTLEILSLSINTENFYKLHTSNYGVIVGRILANDGFGIPNVKISIFVELSDTDAQNTEITDLYPFSSVQSFDKDYRRYNLLPDSSNDDCYRIVGTFPNKRLVLDNDTVLEVYDKYWKYTTVTNNAGDYMIFGVPTGNQTLHTDLDLSDIGVLSQKPRDMFYKGYNIEQFDSAVQFKESTNLNNLTQIISQNQSVYVYPFWGDEDLGEIGITRCDVQISYKFEPTCVFMGSLITDNSSNFIGHYCTPSRSVGRNKTLTTGEGTIEMIRKTLDNSIEDFQIQGNRLIDSDGVWCYQIPMNLDYVKTDEFGNIVPTDNPNKGIPTRARVRFRISYAEGSIEGKNKHRAKILVPNNPSLNVDSSNPQIDDAWSKIEKYYRFGSDTPEECYRDLFWNKVYSIKSYIPRFQTSTSNSTLNFCALKDSNTSDNLNPIPFNKISIRMIFPYVLLCLIFTIIAYIIAFINTTIMYIFCLLRKIEICVPRINLGIVTFPKICLFKFSWVIPRIPCIGINGKNLTEDGTNTVYIPGCICKGDTYCSDFDDMPSNCKLDSNVSDLEDKIQETLSQEYDLVHLNFYNDWLNGTVYLPLWYWKKTKKKKYFFGLFSTNAIDAFCECSYDKTRSYNVYLRSSFTCALKRLITTSKNVDSSDLGSQRWIDKYSDYENWPHLYTGVIKNVQNQDGLNIYYYSFGNIQSTMSQEASANYVRLYSTDLILLGSFNDCDIDGIPKLYRNLPPTTANIPFIVTVKNSDGKPEITGMDWLYDGSSTNPSYKNGLFLNFGCFTADTTSKTCINAERMCELGVTLDMSLIANKPVAYSDNTGEVLEGDNVAADGMITRYEIYDNESRYMFATLNHFGLTEELVNHDTNYPTYRFGSLYPMDFDGSMTVAKRYSNSKIVDNIDNDYVNFKLGDKDIVGRHGYLTSESQEETYFPLYNNSFYMYFGLNEGSTAIDKFLSQYDADCYSNVEYPFSVNIETTNGHFFQRSGSCEVYDTGSIKITCDGISIPYIINIWNSNDEHIYSENVTSYFNEITSGNVGNHKNELLLNDAYTIEVKDLNGYSYSKVATIGSISMQATVLSKNLSLHYRMSETKTSEAEEQEKKICTDIENENYGEIIIDGDTIFVDDYPYHISGISEVRQDAKQKLTVNDILPIDFYNNTSYNFIQEYYRWTSGDNYLFSGSPNSDYTNIIHKDNLEKYISSHKEGLYIKIVVFNNRDNSDILNYGTNEDSWHNLYSDFINGNLNLYETNLETNKKVEINKYIDEETLKDRIENAEDESSYVYEKIYNGTEAEITDKILSNYLIYGIFASGDTNVTEQVYSSLDGYDIKEIYDKYNNGKKLYSAVTTGYTEYPTGSTITEFGNDISSLYEEALDKITYSVFIEPSGYTNINDDCQEHEVYLMDITLGYTKVDGDYTTSFEDCDCNDKYGEEIGASAYTFDSETHTIAFNVWKPSDYTVKFEIHPNEADNLKTYDYYNTYSTSVNVNNCNEIYAYINGMPTIFMNSNFFNTISGSTAKDMYWYNKLDDFVMSELQNEKNEYAYKVPLLYNYSNKEIFENISGLTPSYDSNKIIDATSTETITKTLLTSLFNLLKNIYITEDGGSITFSGSGGKGELLLRGQHPAYDFIEHSELEDQYVYESSLGSNLELVLNPLVPNIIYKIPKKQNYSGTSSGYTFSSGFTYDVEINSDTDNDSNNKEYYRANYFGLLDNKGGFTSNTKCEESIYKKASSVPSTYITPIPSQHLNIEAITDIDESASLDKEVIGVKDKDATTFNIKYNQYLPIPSVDRRLQHRIFIKNINPAFKDCFENSGITNTVEIRFRSLGGILLSYDENNHSIIGSGDTLEYQYSAFKNPSGASLTTTYNDDYYTVYKHNSNSDLIRKFYSFKINGNDITKSVSAKTTDDGICQVDKTFIISGDTIYDKSNNESGDTIYKDANGDNIIKSHTLKLNFQTCSYDTTLDKKDYVHTEGNHEYNLNYYEGVISKGIDYNYTIDTQTKGAKRYRLSEVETGNYYKANPTNLEYEGAEKYSYETSINANAYYFSDEINSACTVYIREVWRPNASISKSSNLNYICSKPTMVFTNNVDKLCEKFFSGSTSGLSENDYVCPLSEAFISKYQALHKENNDKNDNPTAFVYDDNRTLSALTNVYNYCIDTSVDYEPYTNAAIQYYNKDSDGNYGVVSDSSEFYYGISGAGIGKLDNNDKIEVVSKKDIAFPILQDQRTDYGDYYLKTIGLWVLDPRADVANIEDAASLKFITNMVDNNKNTIVKRPYENSKVIKFSSNDYNAVAMFDLVKYSSDYTGITYGNAVEQTIYQNTLCAINYYPKLLTYDVSVVGDNINIKIELFANAINKTLFTKLFYGIESEGTYEPAINNISINYIAIPVSIYGNCKSMSGKAANIHLYCYHDSGVINGEREKNTSNYSYRRYQFITDDVGDTIKKTNKDNFQNALKYALSGETIQGLDEDSGNIEFTQILWELYGSGATENKYIFPYMKTKKYTKNHIKSKTGVSATSNFNSTVTYEMNIPFKELGELITTFKISDDSVVSGYNIVFCSEVNMSFNYDTDFYYCFKQPNCNIGIPYHGVSNNGKDVGEKNICFQNEHGDKYTANVYKILLQE